MNKISDIYAIILCGGRGKRLGNLTKYYPKPLLNICGKPFLDYLVDYIKKFGIKSIIFAAGYKSGMIEKYVQKFKHILNVYISKEKKPLGTAGAIKLAQKYIKSDNFFVFNGDTFCNINLHNLLKFHITKKSKATIVVSKDRNLKNDVSSGYLLLNKDKRIIKFTEKSKISQFVNAGIYVFNKKILKFIPNNKMCSLEYEILPKLKNSFAYITKKAFIDIGTPERYKKAISYFKKQKL